MGTLKTCLSTATRIVFLKLGTFPPRAVAEPSGLPGEGNPLPPDELYLLTVEGLEEEKDVGPEFNQGGEDLDGLSGEAESIGKELEGGW